MWVLVVGSGVQGVPGGFRWDWCLDWDEMVLHESGMGLKMVLDESGFG